MAQTIKVNSGRVIKAVFHSANLRAIERQMRPLWCEALADARGEWPKISLDKRLRL